MSKHEHIHGTDGVEANDRRTDDGTAGTTRRGVLRATAGIGAVGAALGTGPTGSAAADTHAGGAGESIPRLRVEDDAIVGPSGEDVVLRGVNTVDPKRLDVTAPARGRDAEGVIDLATDAERGWHSRVIRLPVQPVDVGEHPPGQGPPPVAFTREELVSYMDDHLDSAVEKCRREGAYCIVDYHRHRDIPWTDEALSEEVLLFWDLVAERYGDEPHVLFEVYNEPQGNPQYGISGEELIDYWKTWRATAQPWVDRIREHSDNVVLVGSPRFSQLPAGALIEPFDGGNLAYTVHVYPAHPPDEPADYDGFVSLPYYGDGEAPYPTSPVFEEFPLFVSEWGFDPDAALYAGGGVAKSDGETTVDPDYGADMREWLSERSLGWTAWVFDPIWDPNMFERPFVGPDDPGIGNPYSDEDGPVPELCPDRPCEWELLDDPYMGELVKEMLADADGGGVPEAPDATYFQVDFVAGEPIEELSADALYAEQDRLMRFARGTRDDGILDKGSAWPSERIRDCLEYGHVRTPEPGTATVAFTVAEGCELTLSLAVYETPNEAFSVDGADEQEFLRAATGTFGPGEHTLTVALPTDE